MENPEVVVGTPSVLLGHVQAKVREKNLYRWTENDKLYVDGCVAWCTVIQEGVEENLAVTLQGIIMNIYF